MLHIASRRCIVCVCAAMEKLWFYHRAPCSSTVYAHYKFYISMDVYRGIYIMWSFHTFNVGSAHKSEFAVVIWNSSEPRPASNHKLLIEVGMSRELEEYLEKQLNGSRTRNQRITSHKVCSGIMHTHSHSPPPLPCRLLLHRYELWSAREINKKAKARARVRSHHTLWTGKNWPEAILFFRSFFCLLACVLSAALLWVGCTFFPSYHIKLCGSRKFWVLLWLQKWKQKVVCTQRVDVQTHGESDSTELCSIQLNWGKEEEWC